MLLACLPINCSNLLLPDLFVRADPFKLDKLDDNIVPVVSVTAMFILWIVSVHNGNIITRQGCVFDSVEEVRKLIDQTLNGKIKTDV